MNSENENKNESATFISMNISEPDIEKQEPPPKFFKKVLPLFYKDGDPLIVIGPQCNFFLKKGHYSYLLSHHFLYVIY
jgi:hypothetical protein